MIHDEPAHSVDRDDNDSVRLERLEPRTLLAGDAFDIHNIAEFKPSTSELSDAKHGPMANAGAELINIYLEYRRAAKNNRAFVSPEPLVLMSSDQQKVAVSLRTRSDLGGFVTTMQGLGLEVFATNEQYSVVQGYLPIDQVRGVAARADVAHVWALYRPLTKREGLADNQADRAQKTDSVRSDFDLDGTGVKIGVISDSADQVGGGLADSQTTGDLPNDIAVLDDDFGSDEGRAMMELIHDIAPGASLLFHTSGGSQQSFANGVRALKNAGASVLVDDIAYLDEPFFQDGVIDTAIREAVTGGATFLTAAGNYSNGGFEQLDIEYTTVGGRTLVDFLPGPGVDTRLRVNFSQGETVSFEWDNPYNGVTGTVTADLDIRFFTAGSQTIRAQGTRNNIATGRPVEIMNFVPGTSLDVEIELEQLSSGASRPTAFKFVRFAGDASDDSYEHSGTRSTVFGHAASTAAISVGAVPFFNAPPFSSTTPIENESFSSFGPATYLFDSGGNRLGTKLTTQKPDISGIDDVNTSFFGSDALEDSDTLPNFAGTSAAAPNVAALVAMMKQGGDSLTQDEILNVLKLTSHPLNGAPDGVWDAQGGFGLVDGAAAIPTLVADPSVDIIDVSPDPRITSVSSIQIKFNQPVNGFTAADLRLTRNGGSNLLSFFQTLTTTDNTTYTLNNLSSVTSVNGNYALSLAASGSGITNLLGKALTGSATETWSKIIPPPLPVKPTGFAAEANGSDAILITWDDNNTAEAGYTLIRAEDADFTINRKTFQLPANTSSFLNTGLRQTTRYYYRVRAHNITGTGPYTSPQQAVTLVTGETIVDNTSPGFRAFGDWDTRSDGAGFIGADYRTDEDAGKGDKSVRYSPTLVPGPYFVYARWNRTDENATNAKYDVFYGAEDSQRKSLLMDQRNRGGAGWVLLGKFTFEEGFQPMVRLGNAGTDGLVNADALRFLPSAPVRTSKSIHLDNGLRRTIEEERRTDISDLSDELLRSV